MKRSDREIYGKIHSFQSLGTVDGPSLRSVIFMQGCPLRCACCHNPDTWGFEGGENFTVGQMVDKVLRFKTYYGNEGGITVSGGEPLMQTEYLVALFRELKANGIGTCLDTSGCLLDDGVKELLSFTDIVLLDFKYTNAEDYLKYTGCRMEKVESFLDYLRSIGKRTWLRYVVIPNLNDSDEALEKLFAVKKNYSCVEKIELLPFRKLCIEKYKEMGIDFPLANTPEATEKQIKEIYSKFDK